MTKRSQFKIESLKNLVEIRNFIQTSAVKLGADPEKTADLILAINEATTNIFIHGFKEQPCDIKIIVEFQDKQLTVSVLDDGPPFDPTQAENPDTNAPLDQRQPGGLGIHMMREYADQLIYSRTTKEQNQLVFKIGGKMDINVENIAGERAISILKLSGELDASCYQDAIDKAKELKESGVASILLDLSDLTFMASSGLISLYNIAYIMRGSSFPENNVGWNVLHEIRDELANVSSQEKNFKILSPQPRIMKTLQMTGFDKLIEIHTDREEALASFG